MKLRLLNGSHSALAYLGALAGFEFIADTVRAPEFTAYARGIMDIDVTPTLDVPHDFDLDTYKNELMGRFANPVLRHRTTQIAMDGSQKLPYRLLRCDLRPGWPQGPGASPCLPGRCRLDQICERRQERLRSTRCLWTSPNWPAQLRAAARSAGRHRLGSPPSLSLREVFSADLAEDSHLPDRY